jgi:hypothetical protein
MNVKDCVPHHPRGLLAPQQSQKQSKIFSRAGDQKLLFVLVEAHGDKTTPTAQPCGFTEPKSPRKCNAFHFQPERFAYGAMSAVATHDPFRVNPVGFAVSLDFSSYAIRIHLELDQACRPLDRMTTLQKGLLQNTLDPLLPDHKRKRLP